MEKTVQIELTLKEALLLRTLLGGLAIAGTEKKEEDGENVPADLMRIDLKISQGILAAFLNSYPKGGDQ